jgi:uncharacterized membrane protein
MSGMHHQPGGAAFDVVLLLHVGCAVALLAMSHGTYARGDGWVLAGLALFVGVAVLAEGVMWPAERRLQAALAAAETETGTIADAGPLDRDAMSMARTATAALVLLVAGTVLMVAQP